MRLLLQSVKSVSQWRPKQQPQQSLGYSAYLSSLSSKDLRARCTSRQCTFTGKGQFVIWLSLFNFLDLQISWFAVVSVFPLLLSWSALLLILKRASAQKAPLNSSTAKLENKKLSLKWKIRHFDAVSENFLKNWKLGGFWVLLSG